MITIGILVVTTVLLIFHLRNSITKWKKLPPGPIRWKFIGNIIEMRQANANYPHIALAKMSEKYGPVMSIAFGAHYAVIVSSLDAIKELFKKDETSFTRFEFPFQADRNYNKNLGVIWGHGLMWRDIRRYTIRTLRDFGFGKSRSMEVILKEEMEELSLHIQTTSEKNNGILNVDLHCFASSAINILWSLVGGYRFQYDNKKLHRSLMLNGKLSEIVGHKNLSNIYPFLKTWFPKLIDNERHKEIHKEIQQFMKELIDEIKEKRLKRLNSTPDSFIEVFLDEIEKNSKDPTTDYTEEQLIVILMDLFFAGSETTSVTINWIVLFLTINPKVQQKLQKELLTVASESTTKDISLKDSQRMPYMKATILESFRVSNFVPMPLPRMPIEDIKFGDYIIPKGTCMFMNLTRHFQDEEYWGPDVKIFRPERFLNETEDALNNERAEKITVFGFGRRICLGESLAWDSIYMYMTTLFTNFTFESIPGETPCPENPGCALMLYPRPYRVQVLPNNN